MGLAVVNALSSLVVATVKRDGNIYQIEFSKGKVTKEMKIIGKCNKDETGTKIQFTPDKEIMKEYVQINEEDLLNNIEIRSYTCKQLKTIYTNEDTGKTIEYYKENGLLDLLKVKNKVPITSLFHEEFEDKEGNEYEIAFGWNGQELGNEFITFCNAITMEQSTSDTYIKNALTKTINSSIKERFPKLKDIPEGDDIREGFRCIISIGHDDPQFSGQNKTTLNNVDYKSVIESNVSRILKTYIDDVKNKKEVEALFKRIIDLSNKRKAALDMRKKIAIVDYSNTALTISPKFSPCTLKDPSLIELCIVEGNSAGSTVSDARDKKTQAIAKLRGKCKKVNKGSYKTVIDNEEYNMLIKALFGTTDYSKIRCEDCKFHRIIVYSDADTDGFHIRSLFINFIYNYFPGLIDLGYVFMAQPPLYRIKEGKNKNVYLKDNSEYAKYIESKIKKTYTINKYSINLSLYDILYNKEEFSEKLSLIQKKYFLGTDMIDTLVYYTCYENNEFIDSVNILLENYEQLAVYEKDGYYNIDGFIGTEYHNVRIDEEFEKDIRELGSIYPEYILNYTKNGKEIEGATLSDFILDVNKNKIEVNRLKGLGEMNADELWESCLDPEIRNLTQVTLDENDKINDEVIKLFFGNNSNLRKDFVDNNL